MNIELCVEAEGAPQGLEALLRRVGEACCQVEGVSGMQAACRLVDDEAIRRVNREFRGLDRATDVLSFPSVSYAPGRTARLSPKRLRREFDPESGCVHLGDFVISIDHARLQAAAYGHSLERELGYLTAHALFHLMGYDHVDPQEKKRMRRLEEEAMALIHLKREEGASMTDRQLFEMAVKALDNAYVPYSHFPVGACLLSEDGRAFSGCNIENASYGATICAERCAVSCAVSQGARAFRAIAVVGRERDAWPCGICRQVLSEFGPHMKVICGNAKSGAFTVATLEELLPRSFGPQDLQ